MPPKKKFFQYNEDDVYKALNEIQSGHPIRETCRKYNIPHSTMINKIKMRHPIQRKMGPPTILTPDEERLLCRWINAMAKKGIPIKKEQLIETVTKIIKADNRPTPFKEGIPGRKWFNNFMKRNPDIAKRHAEAINSARSRVTEEGIRKWHSELKEFLKTENAQDILDDPDRILNADESGFQVCPSSGIVLGPKGMENLYEIKDKEKESITVLGTFTASGKVMPMMIIYPYERIPAEIARNVPEDWCVGKSPKGWMTSRVFYGYIGNSLLPALRKTNVKFPVLLLIDGHKSHITYEVSQLCIENQIILYALHPNATHIIQPADVSVFRPLKNSWKKIVQDWKVTTGNRVVTRAQFAPLLKSAIGAATEEIIRNGFRKCGLFPFDANAIDYTKCMNHASRHTVVEKPTEISSEHLLYFESLMSRNRVLEFRAIPHTESWTGDESAKELFYVWRKIHHKVINACNSSNPSESTADIPNERNLNSEKECTTPAFLGDHIIPNLPIDSTDSIKTSSALLRVESPASARTDQQILQTAALVSPSLLDELEKYDEEIQSPEHGPSEGLQNSTNSTVFSCLTLPSSVYEESLKEIDKIPAPDSPEINIASNASLIRQSAFTLLPQLSDEEHLAGPTPLDFITDDCNSKDREATPTKSVTMIEKKTPEPRTSKILNDQEKTPTKSSKSKDPLKQTTSGYSKITVSPAFASSLVWPTESPLKKGCKKKLKRKRLPDAVTSAEWIQYWNEKNKEQEEKETRKLAREKKKKLQELNKTEKPKAKRIRKRIQNKIDSDSEEDNLPLVNYSKKGRLDDEIELGSYVIVNYEGEYFPGIVKNVDKENKEVSTMILSAPNTFKWPDKEDKIWYANDSIIEKINAPVLINSRGSYKVAEMAKYFY